MTKYDRVFNKKFSPKDFEEYRKEDGETLDEYEARMGSEREAPEEGAFARSPEDVRDDYWADESRAEKEAPPRRQRAVKYPKRMISGLKNRNKRKYEQRKGSRG